MSQLGDRAASEVIGAVILFGFIVVAFTIYQGVVVPQQNKAIEFNHNEAAQDAIQDLRNAIRQTATTGAEESVSIKLGATYPERVLAINPGASAGSLHTESLGAVSIRNVSGTDAEVQDYFGSVTTTLGPFESKVIVYRPIYFQYSNAPNTLYENTLAYNHFPDTANLTITDQAIIDGRKITLIALTGNVSEARQGTISIDTQAVSTATSSVSIKESGGPINITFTTRMTSEEWNETLADQLDPVGAPDDPQKFVTDVRQTGPNQVSIILEQGEQYELKLAKVGVGADTASEGPKYIVDVEGDQTSVAENGTQKLVVEVRDRFNNAISNVAVNAGSPTVGSVTPGAATTGNGGRATFIYEAPTDVDGTQNVTVTMSFIGDGTDNDTVTFDLRVLDTDNSGGDRDNLGDSVNPAGTNSVVLIDQDINQTKCSVNVSGQGLCRVDVTLENRSATNDREIVEVRVNFYGVDRQSAQDPGPPESTQISNVTHVIGEDYEVIDPIVIQAGSTKTFTMPFFEDEAATTPYDEVEIGDFYLLSVIFDDGQSVTYFIGPQEP